MTEEGTAEVPMRGPAERAELQRRASGAVRVIILGEIDLSRFDELDALLASAQAQDPPTIEIDLHSVPFMDSQGLKLLIRAHERASEKGLRVLIVDPDPAVQRLFALTGLTKRFEVAFETGADCPCCGSRLQMGDAAEDGLRPGDGWCQPCKWIVMAEVLAGEGWPVECPTHGQLVEKPTI